MPWRSVNAATCGRAFRVRVTTSASTSSSIRYQDSRLLAVYWNEPRGSDSGAVSHSGRLGARRLLDHSFGRRCVAGAGLAQQRPAVQKDAGAQPGPRQAGTAANDKRREQDAEQDALRVRLQIIDKTHYTELTNAQKNQARLRGRLATTKLRLSVRLDANSAGGCGLPPGTGPSGLVHGARRAHLTQRMLNGLSGSPMTRIGD